MGRQLPSVGLPCSALQAHAIDEAGETGRTTVPRNRTEPDRVGRIPPTRAWRGPLGIAAEAAYGLYGLKSTRQAACQVLTSESLGRVVPERPSIDMAPPWASSTRKTRLPADWERRRSAVLYRDGHRCQIAGPTCTQVATEVDHVVPNDDHGLDNLQAACHPCHWAKSQAESAAARLTRARPGEKHPGLR